MVSWFFPAIMKWNIRQEAVKLAKQLSGGRAELDPGQFNAVRDIDTRFYEIAPASKAVGQTALAIDKLLSDAAVEAIFRNGAAVEFTGSTVVQARDSVAVTGTIRVMETASDFFGHEVIAPNSPTLVQESRELILTNRWLSGRTIRRRPRERQRRDAARRFPDGDPTDGTRSAAAGEPEVAKRRRTAFDGQSGRSRSRANQDRVQNISVGGHRLRLLRHRHRDGNADGFDSIQTLGFPITIGSGAGCLLSGLFFGWLRSVHPRFAALPLGASTFLRDFGLAVFVGTVGIAAGPQALVAIQHSGLTLFFLGVAVTLIPQIVTFFFSYYVLRIKNPIEALACVAGGRSANPAFAALLSKTGNATPVAAFTVTYAVANVFLTLWGPVIVGIIAKNATH